MSSELTVLAGFVLWRGVADGLEISCNSFVVTILCCSGEDRQGGVKIIVRCKVNRVDVSKLWINVGMPTARSLLFCL